MSVQHNTYIIYGVILPWESLRDLDDEGVYEAMEPYFDSAFKPEVNPRRGITIISDGMNGKYHAIGRVVRRTDVYQPFAEPPFAIPSDDQRDLFDLIRANVRETLADLSYDGPLDFGWHVFTHYR